MVYSDDLWLMLYLELCFFDGVVLFGYGWIFLLGNGEVNIGVGVLLILRWLVDLVLCLLIFYYIDLCCDEWGFIG